MNLNDLGLFVTGDETILTARMRYQRDLLLAQSDWAMASDAPTDKVAWQKYRQKLRDFPQTWQISEVADFPERPL